MIERPPRAQIPFILLALPFMAGVVSARDSGPWLVALIVYFLVGGITAMNFWPIAYRTPLLKILAHLLPVAVGAFATALMCALVTTGNLNELFAARAR
jgi:hypothetical protein